jgi:phosphomannomutase/phosphoglucomutase
VECADHAKFDVIKSLVGDFRQSYETIDIDGARVQFGDGWGLVRASNTQPALVLRFEAVNRTRLGEIAELFKTKLAQFPAVKFADVDFKV